MPLFYQNLPAVSHVDAGPPPTWWRNEPFKCMSANPFKVDRHAFQCLHYVISVSPKNYKARWWRKQIPWLKLLDSARYVIVKIWPTWSSRTQRKRKILTCNEVTIPALEMEMLCCSMASWILVRSASFIFEKVRIKREKMANKGISPAYR